MNLETGSEFNLLSTFKLAILTNILIELFSQLNPQTRIFLIAVFALIFGSFCSLLTCRLANNQPIVFTRSKCTNCGFALKILNLIPLFSWIFQREKCSNCRGKISIRYPLIELSFLISFLTIYFALEQSISWKMIIYFLIAATLITMCAIDLEKYFIPNSTQYFLAILTVALIILESGTNGILPRISAAFLYAGFGIALWTFFYFAAKIEAIGVDDIKFFFVSGLMLGDKNFLTFVMLSGISGLLFGTIWQKAKKDQTFPFAPALCLSAFLCLIFGEKINLAEFLGSLIF